MRYSYIAYPNNKNVLYIAPQLSIVKDGSMNLYYYSLKRTNSDYIPEIIRFPIDFVSKEGIVLSFVVAPEGHIFLPETHALFNSYVMLRVKKDLPVSYHDILNDILNDILHKLYLGVMKEWHAKQKK